MEGSKGGGQSALLLGLGVDPLSSAIVLKWMWEQGREQTCGFRNPERKQTAPRA